ncbi:hypothetical protein Hte_002097 [Hypoxylon texense]
MSSADSALSRKLVVAIIGGGPAGLPTAIELSKLDFVDWSLYERKPAISTDITLQRNTWRMLGFMGAARHLGTDELLRTKCCKTEIMIAYMKNSATKFVILLDEQRPRPSTPIHQHSCRARRAKLQHALLREVDQGRIRSGTGLTKISRLEGGGERLRLCFDDGPRFPPYFLTGLLLQADNGLRYAIEELRGKQTVGQAQALR